MDTKERTTLRFAKFDALLANPHFVDQIDELLEMDLIGNRYSMDNLDDLTDDWTDHYNMIESGEIATIGYTEHFSLKSYISWNHPNERTLDKIYEQHRSNSPTAFDKLVTSIQRVQNNYVV